MNRIRRRELQVGVVAVALCWFGLWRARAIAEAETLAAATAHDASRFVSEAATDGALAVELGQLAANHADSAEVKKFARMMMDDHAAAAQKLEDSVRGSGVAVPKGLSSEGQQEVKRMSAMSGLDFDRAYMARMVEDHEDAVALFREASKAQELSEAIHAFASDTLPTLERHLREARRVAGLVG